MKIAMVGHKQIPSRIGGVEVVVTELAAHMAKLGHEVTCYNRLSKNVLDKKTKPLREYCGVMLKTAPALNIKGLSAMTSSFFAALCIAFSKYHIAHFHAEAPCAFLWIPKLFGKRCIATIHGLDHRRAKWGKFASAYIMLGEKCAVKYADEIIVLSENVKQYFKDVYNRETVYIPNGVRCPSIQTASLITSKFGLEKDSYILYLGRIVPEKGLRYLIGAFRQVKTIKKLVIAGASSDTDDFMHEIRQSAIGDGRILCTGFVEGQTLAELFSNAYLYALPSDLEGMPLSLLEAMSYGNCCLVSDIPECADVVEDKAVVFQKSNIGDLTDKLQMLCDNPSLVESYKQGSSDFICRKYEWDDVTARTLNLYAG